MLDLANWSGALDKLSQKSETSPSAPSESSDFQHLQPAQWCAIFLMRVTPDNPYQQLGLAQAMAHVKTWLTLREVNNNIKVT